METGEYTVFLHKKDDIIFLEPIGDVHFGNRACDKQLFYKRVKAIEDDPYRITIFMGDMVENNGPISRGGPNPHFRIKDLDPELMECADQVKAMISLLKPIAKKSMGMHIGNHSDRTFTEKDFQYYFCAPLGVRYLGYSAMTRLRFVYRKQEIASFVILSEHSRISAKTKGNVMNQLQGLFSQYNADIILAGHTHFAMVDEVVQYGLGNDGRTIEQYIKIMANTGSFVKTHTVGYSSYTDMNLGKSGRQTGSVTIKIDPYNKTLSRG